MGVLLLFAKKGGRGRKGKRCVWPFVAAGALLSSSSFLIPLPPPPPQRYTTIVLLARAGRRENPTFARKKNDKRFRGQTYIQFFLSSAKEK